MINHFFSDLRHIGVCFLKCKPRRRVQGEKGLSAVYALGLQAHIPRIFFWYTDGTTADAICRTHSPPLDHPHPLPEAPADISIKVYLFLYLSASG